MKKRHTSLAILLCAVMLFSGITVFADVNDDKVLTLEEAKQIALENDTQYKQQQSYIKQAGDNYEDVYDANSGKDKTSYKNLALKAEASVSRQVAIEKAAFAVEQAIFKKDNLQRTSDYNVTAAYYGVVTDKFALDDALIEMDLKKSDYEVAQIKLEQGLVTKNTVTQAENSYKSAQTAYNKAFTDMQNSMQDLGNEIGETLDVFNVEIDTSINMADINNIDLNRVKSDYLAYSENLFNLRGQLDLMDTQLDLSEEQYDYYYDKAKHMSDEVESGLSEMLSNANRDYDDAKYSLEEAEKELDSTLSSLYSGINNLYESIDDLNKTIESTKVTIEDSRLKFELGLISRLELNENEASLKTLENKLKTTIVSINTQYNTLTRYSAYDDSIAKQ